MIAIIKESDNSSNYGDIFDGGLAQADYDQQNLDQDPYLEQEEEDLEIVSSYGAGVLEGAVGSVINGIEGFTEHPIDTTVEVSRTLTDPDYAFQVGEKQGTEIHNTYENDVVNGDVNSAIVDKVVEKIIRGEIYRVLIDMETIDKEAYEEIYDLLKMGNEFLIQSASRVIGEGEIIDFLYEQEAILEGG